VVSAGVSITLVPMLASRYLKHERDDDPVLRYTAWFENIYRRVLGRYERGLDWCLAHRRTVLFTAIGTLFVTIGLFIYIPKGFFPTEDIGQITVRAEAVEDISFPAMAETMIRVRDAVRANPAVANVIASADETNTGRLFINLKPRSERDNIEKVVESLRRDVRGIPGVGVFYTPLQNLRIGGRISKARYQYVLKSVGDAHLLESSEKMMGLMRADPIFRDVTTDAQLRGLQAQMHIDRD
jgi:HAE1 family hydrophobic/amphiphilic exporter-1